MSAEAVESVEPTGIAGVRRFDHVGIVVEDFPLVVGFFEDLGFQHGDPMRLEGEWIDRIIGVSGAQVEVVMVGAPDGSGRLELIKFHRSADEGSPLPASSNRLGLRHVCYVVDDIDAVVAGLRSRGTDTVGDVVNWENVFKLCYVAGPEGIIVELAEEVRPDRS
jgi:catechol 2,3-dioxygenase-like lactoylglutathione lyase family enzyme